VTIRLFRNRYVVSRSNTIGRKEIAKALADTTLVLLIVGFLASAFNIQPVIASTVAHIVAGDIIDPPTSHVASATRNQIDSHISFFDRALFGV